MKALLHSAPLLSAPPKNRFLISISLLAVALLGLMTSRARADVNAYVNIVNSAETPVMLSLINNEQCRAAFPNGGSSCILQPGQSTVVNGWIVYPEKSVQWNIIYNFYDGTDNINQRISSYGNWGDSCRGSAKRLPGSRRAGASVVLPLSLRVREALLWDRGGAGVRRSRCPRSGPARAPSPGPSGGPA